MAEKRLWFGTRDEIGEQLGIDGPYLERLRAEVRAALARGDGMGGRRRLSDRTVVFRGRRVAVACFVAVVPSWLLAFDSELQPRTFEMRAPGKLLGTFVMGVGSSLAEAHESLLQALAAEEEKLSPRGQG